MSFPFPFPGPIAPETNPTIEPLNYKPSNFTIQAISLGFNTTVTTEPSTSAPAINNFVVGQLVRFTIPSTYGTRQLDGQTGYVLSVPSSNQVSVGIDSTGFTPFVSNPDYGPTPPQIAAIGDINSGPINASGRTNQTTYIQGSFINISPAQQL